MTVQCMNLWLTVWMKDVLSVGMKIDGSIHRCYAYNEVHDGEYLWL